MQTRGPAGTGNVQAIRALAACVEPIRSPMSNLSRRGLLALTAAGVASTALSACASDRDRAADAAAASAPPLPMPVPAVGVRKRR